MKCIHNHRCRYTDGFYCEDCNTFFGKDTPTYRSGELLSSIWMVLHNINVDRVRAGNVVDVDVLSLKDEIGIGIGKKHENFEELISKAEIIMTNHLKNSNSASITL